MLFSRLINVKMPTIVGILTFMSRMILMLSCVKHEKSFTTSGPGSYERYPVLPLYLVYSDTMQYKDKLDQILHSFLTEVYAFMEKIQS